MNKVVYYNMPSGIDYELELLKKWNVTDIELIDEKSTFTAEKLIGAGGLVTEYTHVGAEVFDIAKDLKIVSLQTIGYNEIDVVEAEKRNIAVTNAPGYCAEDVATHAVALLLSCARQTAMFNRDVKNGKWDCFTGNTMHRLSGKTAGLVSFGSIPQMAVSMLKGFGMDVVSYDIFQTTEFMASKGVTKYDDLKEMLGVCDFVLLHTPLLDSTFHMINDETIACMKDGAILINASRGALIDETALVKALKSGKLIGAGLDVLEDEVNPNPELLAMDNVTVTPHVAFLSDESLKQSREMALLHLVQRLSENKVPDCCVNKITL